MKTMLRRYSAALLALVIVLSVSVVLKLPAKAATVDYVYANNGIIKNWGVREELATFLSPNAEKFYDDENITLNELLALDGSSNKDNVPSSALYKKLQTLMANNHSHKTSYGDTRYQYQYTDCQNSGKTSNKISSFYSGKEIGPNWDEGTTWNREHTWPKSKTPYPNVKNSSVNEATDIMSLRPTASSENSSRSNNAYGPTTANNYFNPNHFANGKYDLRGDVARITLYVYVRWGNTSKMWSPNSGETGVIQSKEILLQWMEEDPVDTWELGRNDSVESITGTRNVFVDFPELAFDLFNEEVPSGYKTPSNSTTSSGYKITATSNNTAWGTVSVNKNTVFATSKNGYEAVDFTIVSGNATVERTGDEFVLDTNGNVTIQINFAPIKTVAFVEDGTSARTMKKYQNGTIALPAHKTAIKMGYTFLGWSSAAVKDTEKKPAFLNVGDDYKVSADATLYALYSRKVNGKVVYFTNTSGASAPSVDTSSKNEQATTKPSDTTSSKPSGTTSSKPSTTTSKPSNVTTSKPSSNTASKGEQNVNSNPSNNSSSVENENTSSVLTETETEDVIVTVNISEDTVVVSDFIEEAISNNVPLVLKAKDYTWSFEKIAMPLEDVRNFDAAILTGNDVAKEDKAIIKKAAGGKKFYAFDFAHEGALPSKAIITMRVDDAFAGKNVEIYSLTPSGSKILEGTAAVSSDSILRFKTERASLMFITDAEAGGASLLWLWILIAVVVIGGAVTVFVLYKKGIIFNANKQDLA